MEQEKNINNSDISLSLVSSSRIINADAAASLEADESLIPDFDEEIKQAPIV